MPRGGTVEIPSIYFRLIDGSSAVEGDFYSYGKLGKAPPKAPAKISWWNRMLWEFGVSVFTDIEDLRRLASDLEREDAHYAVVDLARVNVAELGVLKTGGRPSHHDLVGRPARMLDAVADSRKMRDDPS